jgi:hypothetical protein
MSSLAMRLGRILFSISYPLGWIVLAIGICLPSSSHGWGGANGHRFITDTTVEELPSPLKSFAPLLFNEPPGNTSMSPNCHSRQPALDAAITLHIGRHRRGASEVPYWDVDHHETLIEL